MSKKRPPEVERAIARGDTLTLSILGRAGGIASGKSRNKIKAQEEILQTLRIERFEQEMWERAVEAGENICPID